MEGKRRRAVNRLQPGVTTGTIFSGLGIGRNTVRDEAKSNACAARANGSI